MFTNYKLEDIESTVVSVISDALRIDMNNIHSHSRLLKDLNAESLDILDIKFSLEQTLGFKLGDQEIIESLGKELNLTEFSEKFTVKSLVDLVLKKVKNQ